MTNHPNRSRTNRVMSHATCFRGSKRLEKRFQGRASRDAVEAWLRSIDGMAANVHVCDRSSGTPKWIEEFHVRVDLSDSERDLLAAGFSLPKISNL